MQCALNAGGTIRVPRIRRLEVQDIGIGSGALGEVLRCTLTYEDDIIRAPASVVVKLATSSRRSRLFARFTRMYQREYAWYRQLAPQVPVRLPAFLYGDFEAANHRFVLVLEDLQGMEVMDQIVGATPARAARAIRCAAKLHAHFWNRLDAPPAADFLASLGRRRRWLLQVPYLVCLGSCLSRFGSLFSKRMRRLAEAYGWRMHLRKDELARGPKTLTHGDFRLENMFFGADDDTFAVIDWQAAGLWTCGLYDVAYFMTTSVPTAVRRDIEREVVRQYHGILRSSRVEDFTWDECWRLYRQNVLDVLVSCICVGGGLDLSIPRMRKLAETMLRRALAAIGDLDADEFLPGGRSSLSVRALSMTVSCAYGTGRSLGRLRRRTPGSK